VKHKSPTVYSVYILDQHNYNIVMFALISLHHNNDNLAYLHWLSNVIYISKNVAEKLEDQSAPKRTNASVLKCFQNIYYYI